MIFSHIRYSRLIAIADGHSWSKKTYNNAISVLKRAFDFGNGTHVKRSKVGWGGRIRTYEWRDQNPRTHLT
jgi:hypothetical protein